MKIAVASEDNTVAQHFGHCKNYNLYTVENKKIENKEVVENPGHKTGFLPKFLAEKDIDVIISGGMGSKAVDIFNKYNIKVVIGAQGDSKKAVEMFLEDKLESVKAPCEH